MTGWEMARGERDKSSAKRVWQRKRERGNRQGGRKWWKGRKKGRQWMCVMATERAKRGRGRERERRGRQGGSVCQVKRKRKREWGEGRPLIDDSDSMSRQMLLDQIDTMWVESRRLFTDRERRRREDMFREERRRLKKEQTDRHKTACHRHGWARQRSHFLFFSFQPRQFRCWFGVPVSTLESVLARRSGFQSRSLLV